MRPWRQPELPEGALKDLNDALHELHGRSGYRSSRYIAERLHQRRGGSGPSHTVVHRLLISPDLPKPELMLWVVELLAGLVRTLDPEQECDRFDGLWQRAFEEQRDLRRQRAVSATESQDIVHPPDDHTVSLPSDAIEVPAPMHYDLAGDLANKADHPEISDPYTETVNQFDSDMVPVRLRGDLGDHSALESEPPSSDRPTRRRRRSMEETGGISVSDLVAQHGKPKTLLEPFGPGSASPLPGGAAPSPQFRVKARTSSMVFHDESSPFYENLEPQVWFRDRADAERAGFGCWDRPRVW